MKKVLYSFISGFNCVISVKVMYLGISVKEVVRLVRMFWCRLCRCEVDVERVVMGREEIGCEGWYCYECVSVCEVVRVVW